MGLAAEPLFPGAHGALEGSGLVLAISTNKSRAGTDYALAHHNIDQLFVHVRCPDAGHAKPHADAVHHILAKTGVLPRHTLFVGDTETDMMRAANAGVKALGVAWGYHSPARLTASGAVAIAGEFADVPRLVRELLES